MIKLTFKKTSLILLATLLALHWLCVQGAMSAQLAAAPSNTRAELLVKLRRAAARGAVASAHAPVGATVVRSFDELGWQLVRLPVGLSASAGMAHYRTHPDVAAVEPNGVVHIPTPPPPDKCDPVDPWKMDLVTPNDPRYPSQWNLSKIGMPVAWEVTTGSSNVVVAVMDTGVDYTHPDLRDNMWRNPGETGLDAEGKDKATNGADDDDNGYVDDVFGIDVGSHDSDPMDEGYGTPTLYHGTECAGIIGAVGNNGSGTAGIAWSVQIMAVGLGWYAVPASGTLNPARTFVANIVEGFNYVIQQRRRGVNIRITSNSWSHNLVSQAIQEAFEVAGREGILSVCSAGNNTLSVDNQWRLPSGFDSPYVLSVAASDQSDQLTSSSNFGRSTVDLAAPGIQIPMVTRNSEVWGGTSAACPHVAVAAALLLAVKPEATPVDLKAALMQSVDQPIALRNKVVSHGRLNVSRALQVLTNTMLPAVVVGASPAASRTQPDAQIEVWFSTPMERASVVGALEFTPAILGTIEWSEGDRLLRLRPSVPLLRTNYTARIRGTARDVVGRTIDGDFDRASEGAPTDDFAWGFRFAPVNDDFVGAVRLTGTQGSLGASTVNCSQETDEPLGNEAAGIAWPSLWYRWLAETDGWMTFETLTSGALDTVMVAYNGQTLDALAEVAYGDDFGLRKGGRISFPVSAGTDYFITVVGKWLTSAQQAFGSFALSWYPTPPPGFTGSQFLPAKAAPGSTVTLSGTHFTGATSVLFNDVNAAFTHGPANNTDLRIIATVPPDAVDGPITIRTPHGDVTSTIGFMVLPPRLMIARDANDRVEVSWPATSSAFVLEATESLDSPTWLPVESSFVATNGHTVFRPGAIGASRFYRLKKP